MAKPTEQQWAKAKALYGNGKSLREIEKVVEIPYKTIEYRAKKEGWSNTEVAQQIIEQTRVEAKFLHMEPAQQDIVRTEVSRRLAAMEFYASKARETVEIGFKSFEMDPSPLGMKTILDGLKSGMQVEGIVPFYPNPSTTNINANASSNAQAAVIRQPSQIIFEGGD